jgi:hypothetical protein
MSKTTISRYCPFILTLVGSLHVEPPPLLLQLPVLALLLRLPLDPRRRVRLEFLVRFLNTGHTSLEYSTAPIEVPDFLIPLDTRRRVRLEFLVSFVNTGYNSLDYSTAPRSFGFFNST